MARFLRARIWWERGFDEDACLGGPTSSGGASREALGGRQVNSAAFPKSMLEGSLEGAGGQSREQVRQRTGQCLSPEEPATRYDAPESQGPGPGCGQVCNGI